jgi:biotin transport system substrate-specific component
MFQLAVAGPSGFDPLRLGARSLPLRVAFVLAGTLALALASRISVPMVPVPITMQTFAVTMIGALYGWRLGTVTVLAWLGEAMVGLPVLAGGAGGIAPFAGPTAGYLVAFPLMAAMVGWLAERGWTGARLVLSFAAHFAANIFCLVLGGAWLATLIGTEKALMLGVVPFILGAVLKSALAAALLKAVAGKQIETP